MAVTRGETPPSATAADRNEPSPRLLLRLYVAESAPNSIEAETNLRVLLERLASDEYRLEIVDCLTNPLRALHDGVVVTPMLVRLRPDPVRRVVGTLNDRDVVASTLGISDPESWGGDGA